MAAPKNNQFWTLRSKHGRDKLFSDAAALWEASCEYFEHCDKNPLKVQEIHSGKRMTLKKLQAFTVTGLSLYLGVNKKYFYDFMDAEREKGNDSEFFFVIQQIMDVIHTQKLTAAYAGAINANVAIRDLGLKETVDTTNNNTNTNVNWTTVPVSKEEAKEIAKSLEDEY